VPVAVAAVGPLRVTDAEGGTTDAVGVGREQRVDEPLHQLAQQIGAGLGKVLVQKLGGVDTGASGHRCASLRVGFGRFLEESRGDRARVYARAVTTTYTTVQDSTQAPSSFVPGRRSTHSGV
jgi:hypothetical protein